MNTYLYDKFVCATAGAPIRIFQFGKLVKGGRVRQITKELARKFRIPHFSPAIKLGSHDETTPAGGHLVGLEVRDDGLYGIPLLNEAGHKAIANGSYKYQSPEVIWEDDKGFEDPTTGELIGGPLVVGMALLHSPHLGESASLYRVEPLGEKPAPELPPEEPDRITGRLAASVELTEKDVMKAKASSAAYIARQRRLNANVDRLLSERAEVEGWTYPEVFEWFKTEHPGQAEAYNARAHDIGRGATFFVKKELFRISRGGYPYQPGPDTAREEELARFAGVAVEIHLAGIEGSTIVEAVAYLYNKGHLKIDGKKISRKELNRVLAKASAISKERDPEQQRSEGDRYSVQGVIA